MQRLLPGCFYLVESTDEGHFGPTAAELTPLLSVC